MYNVTLRRVRFAQVTRQVNHIVALYIDTQMFLQSLYCTGHVKKTHEELGLKYKKMYWLVRRRSALSIQNKLMVYTQILNPVWT
jgi:hypothetical protein